MYRDLIILGEMLKIRALESQLKTSLNNGRTKRDELQSRLIELKSRVSLLDLILDHPTSSPLR